MAQMCSAKCLVKIILLLGIISLSDAWFLKKMKDHYFKPRQHKPQIVVGQEIRLPTTDDMVLEFVRHSAMQKMHELHSAPVVPIEPVVPIAQQTAQLTFTVPYQPQQQTAGDNSLSHPVTFQIPLQFAPQPTPSTTLTTTTSTFRPLDTHAQIQQHLQQQIEKNKPKYHDNKQSHSSLKPLSVSSFSSSSSSSLPSTAGLTSSLSTSDLKSIRGSGENKLKFSQFSRRPSSSVSSVSDEAGGNTNSFIKFFKYNTEDESSSEKSKPKRPGLVLQINMPMLFRRPS